jgi:hypothetical protein
MKSNILKLKNYSFKQTGYTVMELIVAIQLTLIVLSLVYVSYLLSSNLLNRWRDKVEIESHIGTVSRLISKNINEITKIISANSTELVALKKNGEQIHISIAGHFYINQKEIELGEMEFQWGRIDYYIRPSKDVDKLTMLDLVNPEELELIEAVKIELMYNKSNKKYPITVTSRLLLKKQIIIRKL